MEVFFHLHEEYVQQRFILALGNFDGVHIAHQQLLREVADWAEDENAKSAVLIFQPHPLEVLQPDKAMFYLSSFNDKLRHIAAAGIQCCFCIDFNAELAGLSAELFLKKYLNRFSDLKGLVVGYNYTFGFMGRGNCSFLKQELADRVPVRIIPPVRINDQIVSSSYIRQLIRQGRFADARTALGYIPFFRGTVVHGDQRGRSMGFPTINISFAERYALPERGVYAVKTEVSGKEYYGAANVGIRPTFGGDQKTGVEIFLLDFCGEIYANEVKVEFCNYLRPERKFDSGEELIKQIEKDVHLIRGLLEDDTRGK